MCGREYKDDQHADGQFYLYQEQENSGQDERNTGKRTKTRKKNLKSEITLYK